jgi:hypothetical protein
MGAVPSFAPETTLGGYYADGAYYVPGVPPASPSAEAASATLSGCPVGYGLPTLYVARTATMVRLQWVWPGGDAPGFPYEPVYASQAQC